MRTSFLSSRFGRPCMRSFPTAEMRRCRANRREISVNLRVLFDESLPNNVWMLVRRPTTAQACNNGVLCGYLPALCASAVGRFYQPQRCGGAGATAGIYELGSPGLPYSFLPYFVPCTSYLILKAAVSQKYF
jgi:hypothetical protein